MQIGRLNKLSIKRNLDNGVHLEGGEQGDVFLPKKYLSSHAQVGDLIEVFVFEDKDNHLRATTAQPKAMVDEFAKLKVVATSPSGAYLDWGMPKDLLVPKSEQFARMEKGKAYVVYVFLDPKTNRIAASTKLDKFLSILPPSYDEGDEVELIICEKSDLGYKAIVNNAHWGMIYSNEVFQKLQIGQKVKGYIKKIRDDHKIDLSLQESGYQRVDKVSQGILEKIKAFGGTIALTDKSPPEDIYAVFEVSKKTFKKAIGALYKRRLITLGPQGITAVQK